jgi:ABC-type nitrate/sulfonate/bicarbonate transport system permease component
MSAQPTETRVAATAGATPAARAARRVQRFASTWVLAVALVVVWQAVAASARSLYFPPPLEILDHARTLWLSGSPGRLYLTDTVFDDVAPGLARMLIGWVLAVAIGVGVGLLVGRAKVASDLADPTLQFLRSVPAPAIIPVFLVLFGTGNQMRIALIAFGSVWPVLLNSADGVRAVDPQQLDAARAFGLPLRARILRVLLPAALPKILTGMRVSLSLALILMVVSELVAATDGIGYQLAQAQQTFRLADMWAWILLLAVLGFVFNTIFAALERRLTRWHIAVRRREGA